jgi:NTE family protein
MPHPSLHDPFSLVLSGGGALGIAHLGVLADMEQLGIAPAQIVGTSMGGIVGAQLAIGMSEAQMYTKVEEFARVSKWLNLSFDGNAIIKSHKIRAIFEEEFGDRMMKDTQIPLTVIGTDLLTGEKHLFTPQSNTRIVDALLTTMAIPGVFEEQHIDGDVLGDGFLVANLGVEEADHKTILAVDVLGSKSFEPTLPDNFFKTANIMEMLDRSLRLLILNQTRTTVRHSDKTIHLIEPPTAGYKTFHFNKAAEIRALGLGLLKKTLTGERP